MTRTLILAADAAWAETAARLVAGDAVVHIGDPGRFDRPAGADFDDIVIGGDPADERQLTSSFEVADRCLGAGGRVAVIIAGCDPARADGPDSALVSAPFPADVAVAWRVVGMHVELPAMAITFQRAADADGASATSDAFLRAQALGRAWAHADAQQVFPERPGDDRAQPRTQGEVDAELSAVRRELAAYKNSRLGRLTTRYWRLRRSIDQRMG